MRSAIYVCRNWPYFARNGGSRREIMSAIKIVIIALGLAAGSLFGASAGQAAGDATWCAVINLGMGDVHWDCQYRTVEECVPNVIAGNRGFCNLNPWAVRPAPASAATPIKQRSKPRTQRG